MNDMIVELEEGVDVNAWIKNYQSNFGATIKRKISPNQNFYLITKDPDKGSIDTFYQALKRDRYLVSVSFDKETKYRQ